MSIARAGRQAAVDQLIDVENTLAVIEKGQQMAGHFPSAEALDRARRILTGEVSADSAEVEMNSALARIVEEERAAARAR